MSTEDEKLEDNADERTEEVSQEEVSDEEVTDEELEDASGGASLLLPAVQKIRRSPENLRPPNLNKPDSLRDLGRIDPPDRK